MVLLALANVFVYALRYGVLSWTPTYLSQVHHVSVTKGIAGFSLFELAGLVGTLACGWVSDKVFHGNRTKTGITFMVGVGISLVAYWLAPVGTPYWLLTVSYTHLDVYKRQTPDRAGRALSGPVCRADRRAR